jgi:aspartate-semialdehyde dehydrogenase
MKLAIIGATGLVGSKMIEILEERNVPVAELIPVASVKSAGKEVVFQDQKWQVYSLEDAIEKKPDFALFSAGASVSLEWAPKFAEVGCTVIDNSSAWRMEKGVPLVVPEINMHTITPSHRIIANPNCSTIQMVMALCPLHRRYRINRIVVSTYQSVSGSGQKGVRQLLEERGEPASAIHSGQAQRAYPHPIDLNLIPQIDQFLENGYTKEEMKMVNETRKILEDDSIAVSPTTVRVPVVGSHSESVNVTFHHPIDMDEVHALLQQFPGIVVEKNPHYPMPLNCTGRDEVFVGRIRHDPSEKNAINMWIVADNLRKGAATNAVQIVQRLRF